MQSRRYLKRTIMWLLPVAALVVPLGWVLECPGQPISVRRFGGAGRSEAREDIVSSERAEKLRALARRLRATEQAARTPLYGQLRSQTRGPLRALNASPDILLTGVDERGFPHYLLAANLNAALTISTEALWPDAGAGFALIGLQGIGELAVWETGAVLLSHQEFGGRVISADGATSVQAHATHIAGTMVAAGVNPAAHGMASNGLLSAYDWLNDSSEMADAAAAGLLISNHSYASGAGWYRSSIPPYDYYWFGDVTIDENEDPGFGYYDRDAQEWDEIAYLAPYYLIVTVAGNNRNDHGPAEGEGHYYWDPDVVMYMWSTQERAPDGGESGYDTLPYRCNAKNLLVVGAVADIPDGYHEADDVQMSSFSGFGPTDDGRIKPDLVANGIAVLSCYDSADTAYALLNGTSMAAPSVAGTLSLLAQQYRDSHAGQTARAATLRALLIHTADEAGLWAGPDYSFGWGLMNSLAAAELIAADSVDTDRIGGGELASGEADTLRLYSNGFDPVGLTLAWTDPAGVSPPWSLDPPDPMLVHDLDLRLEREADGALFLPYVLDPTEPTAPATNGDNARDNIERIVLVNPDAGFYRAIVSHKAELTAVQEYSFIQSGLGEHPPAAPEIHNLFFTQRSDGSGLVDVHYDLEDADSPVLHVALSASADNAESWDLNVETVSGDVGDEVMPGPGKVIVWDFAVDNPDIYSTTCVIRLEVDDDPQMPQIRDSNRFHREVR